MLWINNARPIQLLIPLGKDDAAKAWCSDTAGESLQGFGVVKPASALQRRLKRDNNRLTADVNNRWSSGECVVVAIQNNQLTNV